VRAKKGRESRLNTVSVAVSMLPASFEVCLGVFKQLIFLYFQQCLIAERHEKINVKVLALLQKSANQVADMLSKTEVGMLRWEM